MFDGLGKCEVGKRIPARRGWTTNLRPEPTKADTGALGLPISPTGGLGDGGARTYEEPDHFWRRPSSARSSAKLPEGERLGTRSRGGG